MKRHVYTMPEIGRLQLIEQDLAEPGPEQVQVETRYSVISAGTEVALLTGKVQPWRPLPFELGYATAGVLKAVGPGVEAVAVGDQVAAVAPHASLSNVSLENIYSLPAEVSLERSAGINLGIITMQAVRKARIELGETVVIVGMGLIGQLAMQLARAAGAAPIIAVDTEPARLELAQRNGADYTLEADDKWNRRLMDLLPDPAPGGAEVVIEATGLPDPVNDALAAAGRFGRVVLLGSTRGEGRIDWYSEIHKKGLNVIGAHQGTVPRHERRPGLWPGREDGLTWLRLIAAGRIDPAAVLTDRFPAREAPAIYQRLMEGDRGLMGVLLDWRGFNLGLTTGSGDGI